MTSRCVRIHLRTGGASENANIEQLSSLRLGLHEQLCGYTCGCAQKQRFRTLAGLRSHLGKSHQPLASSTERYAVIVDAETDITRNIPINAFGFRVPDLEEPPNVPPEEDFDAAVSIIELIVQYVILLIRLSSPPSP